MSRLIIPTSLKKNQRILSDYGDYTKELKPEQIDRWQEPLGLEQAINLIDNVPFVKFNKRGGFYPFQSKSRLQDEAKFIHLVQAISGISHRGVVIHFGPSNYFCKIKDILKPNSRIKYFSSRERANIKVIQQETKFSGETFKVQNSDILSLLVKFTCRSQMNITFFFPHCSILAENDEMAFHLYDVNSRYKSKIYKIVKSVGLYIR